MSQKIEDDLVERKNRINREIDELLERIKRQRDEYEALRESQRRSAEAQARAYAGKNPFVSSQNPLFYRSDSMRRLLENGGDYTKNKIMLPSDFSDLPHDQQYRLVRDLIIASEIRWGEGNYHLEGSPEFLSIGNGLLRDEDEMEKIREEARKQSRAAARDVQREEREEREQREREQREREQREREEREQHAREQSARAATMVSNFKDFLNLERDHER